MSEEKFVGDLNKGQFFALLGGAAVVLGGAGYYFYSKQQVPEKTLYEKLGGEPAIQAVVTKMYEGIFSDPELTEFFTKTDKENQKVMQKKFLTQLTGGPKIYDGKDMIAAHKGRGIKDKEFNLVAGHVVTAMNQLNVPKEL